MGKNIIIGVLAVAVLATGGYLLSKKDNTTVVDNSTPGNTYNTPADTDTSATPGKPEVTTVNGASPSSTTAIVAGKVNPNGPATSYWFDYGETASLGSKTTEQGLGSGQVLLSATGFITGLKANTGYYYRLSARNIYGTSNGTTYTFSTNNAPLPVGKAPTATTNSATSVERTGANLQGRVNPNGVNTNYWFEYGKDNSFGTSTNFQAMGNGSSSAAVGVAISGLEPLTKYFFRLNAQNQFGTVNGSTLSFTTKGPASSAQPTVTTSAAASVTSTGAELNGRVNPNGAETTYWFEYSQDSLLGSLIGSGTSPSNIGGGASNTSVKTNVSGLAKDTKYYYRLVARNERGTVQGSIMSFTTKK